MNEHGLGHRSNPLGRGGSREEGCFPQITQGTFEPFLRIPSGTARNGRSRAHGPLHLNLAACARGLPRPSHTPLGGGVCGNFYTRELGLGGGTDLCKATEPVSTVVTGGGRPEMPKIANGYSRSAKMSTWSKDSDKHHEKPLPAKDSKTLIISENLPDEQGSQGFNYYRGRGFPPGLCTTTSGEARSPSSAHVSCCVRFSEETDHCPKCYTLLV